MPDSGITVHAAIVRAMSRLTASERKLANAVLTDYPFNGLQTVAELSARTGVSAPSITRFVSKVGYGGYQDFQRHLIEELKESRRSPLDLRISAIRSAGGSVLADYAGRVIGVMEEMADTIPEAQFREVCALLADPSRRIFVRGGRITDTLARFLSLHLGQVRDKVHHLPCQSDFIAGELMAMRRKDVVIIFDFRRYQPNLARLGRLVGETSGATVVLVTDKWMSPIARDSRYVFGLPIGIGTAWDTGVSALALVEAIIVQVSEASWPSASKRMQTLDTLRSELDDGVAMKDGA